MTKSEKQSIDNYIPLLDHGFVRLCDSMGNDLSIVRAARNSFDAAWRAGKDEHKDEKLIRYLMFNRHTTPFEAVTITFEIKAPIFVFRQWHRHRTQSYNEVSARYTELPNEMFIPDLESIGVQSLKNKQARTLGDLDPEDRIKLERSLLKYEAHIIVCYDLYKELLDEYEWPRELARCVLPFAIYSKMFATMNLHNLFHFLGLRAHSHAQYEIRVYAEAMLKLLENVVPVACQAWCEMRDDQVLMKSLLKEYQEKKKLEEVETPLTRSVKAAQKF